MTLNELGLKLWVGVFRLPRSEGDWKGLACCPGQEKEGVGQGQPPLAKDGCRTYGARASLRNATQPLRAGLSCGAPTALDSRRVETSARGGDAEHDDAVGGHLGGEDAGGFAEVLFAPEVAHAGAEKHGLASVFPGHGNI